MPRFFISEANISGGTAYLSDKDFEHIRVLRLKEGELVTVCDGKGWDYSCKVRKPDGFEPVLEVVGINPSEGEPAIFCSLYAAFPKGDKSDTIVQKAVELGASKITLFPSARCVSRPQPSAVLKKRDRWQKISEEAAKQCGRGLIPEICVLDSFKSAVTDAVLCDLSLFLYEEEREMTLKRALLENGSSIKSVSVMTGSEGGFEPEEALAAKTAGMSSVSLGKRILRCETAPLAALTAIMILTDNM